MEPRAPHRRARLTGLVAALTLFFAAQTHSTVGEPALLVRDLTTGCANFDGHVDHHGRWWSANSALLGVDDVPDSWWDGDAIPGRIEVGDEIAVFRADGMSVVLRPYSELHCAIG